jgi:hypothetical protein
MTEDKEAWDCRVASLLAMTERGVGMTERKNFLKYLLQLGEKWSKIGS